jgi:MFS family permease
MPAQGRLKAIAEPASAVRRSVADPKGGRPLLRLLALASITVSFLAASSAPTPLYATYQAAWGFSALATTVVFGVYALAFLAALLTAGRLSDHIGRRPLLLAGIAGQLIALAVFIDAHNLTALLTARIIQGLATGGAIGAVGAGMLDIDQMRGAVANATAPGLGTAIGVLLSAVAVQWLPAPTQLIYIVFAGLLVIQMVVVALLLPETSPRAPGAWRSLIPQLSVPAQTRRPLLAAAPVLFAVWALAAFYGSLGPALIDHLVGSASVVDGGLGLGILAGVASLTTYLLRALPAPSVMLIGTSALIAGVAAVLLSLSADSSLGFFAGTTLAGVGFGAGFQGGIRMVAPLARPDQRAGVLSVLFTVSYLGLGVPAVAAGFAVAKGGGLVATSYEYGAAVIVLAVFAGTNLVRLRTPTATVALTSRGETARRPAHSGCRQGPWRRRRIGAAGSVACSGRATARSHCECRS